MNDLKDVSDVIEKEIQRVRDFINQYAIEIGVIDGTSKNERSKDKDLTNAQLMYIHELGSPIRQIPARPVLEITIVRYLENGEIDETILRCINGALRQHWSDERIVQELERLCKRMQNAARKIIYDNDGTLEPNAESTVKAKGFNHPLFKTGQLARSITCRLVKVN